MKNMYNCDIIQNKKYKFKEKNIMNQTTQLFLFYIVIIAVLILPSFISGRRKRKQKNEMLSKLKVGNKVITIGGIKGEVASISEDSVELKIDRSARITIMKSAISSVSE